MTDFQTFGDHQPIKRRLLWPAMKNGLRCKCPKCGQGRLFSNFAKSVDLCGNCGEEIFHHRADDLPAYLNLFVVGHIVVGLYLLADRVSTLSAWTEVFLWTFVAVIMTVILLQPIKGFVIGLQWANRMHGFGGAGEDGTMDRDTDPTHYG
ncbi:MAG: DUF983 domain-containing protein [Ahrensia sp.]|nr:DUF983 domain-containing protein [Ahrensia sp.]